MAEEVRSQWVVRLPDRLMLLSRPVSAIRVFSTAEVLHFKTYYGSGDSKSRIERQHDANTRREDVTVAYWVLLFPMDGTLSLPLEVLCCTVQRATADRILDELWVAMFTNCGDNTFVDLRELLAADLVTPEQAATASATGRFVDLGDGDLRRPAVAVTGVDTAAIPVQTVPMRPVPQPLPRVDNAMGTGGRIASTVGGLPSNLWTRAANVGSSVGHASAARLISSADYSGIELRAQTAAMHVDADMEGLRVMPDLAAVMRQSTVPNIGRGMDRNEGVLSPRDRDRIQTQVQAALMRQQAENRNTHAPPVLLPVDYPEFWQPGAGELQAPPDNDAVDRVDPGF